MVIHMSIRRLFFFFENELSLSLPEKIQNFKQKLKFWQTCICHGGLDHFLMPKNFLMRSVVILTNV